MDELAIRNEIGPHHNSIPADVQVWTEWHKKYARIPMRVGGKWIWRKHYWIRMCMKDDLGYVIALKEPRLEGYFYAMYENMHEDTIKVGKKGLVKLIKS